MKKSHILFEENNHRWAMIARDPEKQSFLIDTNEYLISHNNEHLLTDPGGSEIFPAVFAALASIVNPLEIRTLFASHQDPDIISSLSLWLECSPQIKCHISRLWSSFIPHFGGDNHSIIPIPDQGGEILVGTHKLQAIPAHFLHSSGNFHLYDPLAKILFSGDIGAAMLPAELDTIIVKNFDQHIAYAKGFHQRWMGSQEAKLDWCERVSSMNIEQMCPQHGSVYQGEDVERFINWFAELPVGLAYMQNKTGAVNK